MNLLNSFNDFYDNLSSNGLFFFWIVVFLFVFLIFLLIVLYFKNKKLIKLIRDNKIDTLKEDVVKEVSINGNNAIKEEILENNSDTSSLNDFKDTIKEEVNEEVSNDILMVNDIKPVINDIKPAVNEMNITNDNMLDVNGPYKKNILREMNTRGQTSPISIVREEDNSTTFNDYNDGLDTRGIDLGEDGLSPLENMEDVYDVNDSMRFASDVVSRMERDVKPSNIELTEYEKKQEEEAIISYDELLKVKDKIYNITEDEEDDEFIDELKNFRLDLE